MEKEIKVTIYNLGMEARRNGKKNLPFSDKEFRTVYKKLFDEKNEKFGKESLNLVKAWQDGYLAENSLEE